MATTVKPRQQQTEGRSVVRPGAHFCRIAQHVGAQGADFIMFEPADVDWRNRNVLCWTPENRNDPFGRWVKKRCRLPDVIYENIFVHLAVKGYSAGMRRAARACGIPVFNPPLFNKLQMCDWLAKSDLRKYVPDTYRLTDTGDAVRKIRDWGLAYVKPIGGYGGMGVTRIQRLADNRFRVSVDRRHGEVRRARTVMTDADLRTFLARRRHIPHILQKGIHLLRIGGRSVDFRVVVQRGGDGHWHVIGVVPKMASPDGVVTNIIAGGERKTLAQCITLAGRENKTIPVRELETCALRIAARISAARPKVGIIGFDLGADEQGNVYIIEMNPKPARSLLDAEMKRKLARHQAEFAVFLARKSRD